MISQKMQDSQISCLEVLVPRGLIQCGKKIATTRVTYEGLCPISIYFKEGLVVNIEPIMNPKSKSLKILLPRFVEPHAHLDKAFTWGDHPNLSGTYEGALKENLEEHQKRTKSLVLARSERALKLASFNGFRAIRSHVDSTGLSSELTWEALIELQHDWRLLIQLELVALVPLAFWSTSGGGILAKKIAKQNACFGGVLVPPFKPEKVRKDLYNLFKIANDMGCGVDLHIDESAKEPGSGLKELINVLGNMKVDVPITCSHLSSMGLLKPREIKYFATQLAKFQINVISLPLTNAWLLGRKTGATAIERPIAPISQLQHAGVNVAIGGDNVRDPWFPAGNFDPLMLMSQAMLLAQLAPWNRFGLSPFTSAPARIMRLEWDGSIGIGVPADFILLDANNWSELLSGNVKRKIIIKGKFLEGNNSKFNQMGIKNF